MVKGLIKILIALLCLDGALVYSQGAPAIKCPCINRALQTLSGDDRQFEAARCQLESPASDCHNPTAGIKTMTQLADNNYPKAQYLIGHWSMSGKAELKVNYKKALSLLTKAAGQNIVAAYHDLGWLYETGKGTRSDLDKALALYTKAEAAGDIRGKLGLKRIELARLKLQYPGPKKNKTDGL